MTKRDWYVIGLIVCIVLYVLIFVLAIFNYQAQIEDLSRYAVKQKTALEIQRNYILILNPFWIGIFIFGVLVAKTKS
jgi:formate-dependent nitrite reductase membrane component NrfD